MTLSKQFLKFYMAFTMYINTHIYTINRDHIYNIIKLLTFTTKFIMQYTVIPRLTSDPANEFFG